ncbi:electron transport complex subunit RsxC [Agarivorans sp. 1_MG-2023]|uniref:electron transport complex subunit RsxC n=1 Tax=Agarivorans sp. 1_MG-2023 TaxID=3062634 RepID=UPI0026E432D5|nr:electron transport complex subunit RsxC [Agarivorans sp. 1_MG-2023]MDO6766144.1 electron transport complex subunit RsxC [Agarivorans sp. 1_MG-2023]
MVAWLEKIKQGFTWNYKGGVHPSTNKQNINCDKPETIDNPAVISIPVQQHIGSAGKLLVEVGDKVLRAQALTESQFFQAPPVHASCSGEVIAIEPRITAHASAIPELSVLIKVDKTQQDAVLPAALNGELLTAENICQRVHQSGISGMGGAGFPTALKITPHKALDVLIINGAECEPYISADDCLMRNYAAEIIKGVALLQKVLQPAITIVAVEDDKPEAIKALEENTNDSISIRSIPTKYPSGGEKQLIQVLTGKEVGAKQLPIDLGMLVQNVGTAYAIHRAVNHGEPLISRIVTLAGDLVATPSNYWVPVGTRVEDVIANKLQAASETPTIMGGSMMGFMLPSNQAPIVKTTNCLIVNHPQAAQKESPCIRCGECAQACPMGLLPQQLYWFAQGDELNKARDFNIMDCIECGACAFVCPSEISLVQHYRTAKAKIKAEDIAQKEADVAKLRFDARQARLENDKLERKAKHQQAALRRQAQTQTQADDKPDPVAAALARVKKAKSEAPTAKQTDTGEWVPDNQAAIAQREARKAQKRQQQENSSAKATSNPAVAAAIARAKAKKESTTSDELDSTTHSDTKTSANPAVAAAIARAKAKKLASEQQVTIEEANNAEPEEPVKSSANPAVAAAIARAKAKKLASEQQVATEEAHNAEPEEPVKSSANPAVAAAIARAKAKKLSSEQQVTTEEASNIEPEEAVKSSANPAVAAAIARAKAKKSAAASSESADDTEIRKDENSQAIADKPKKVNPAVAAAVARAKAKKVAEQKQREENESNDNN